MLHGKASRTARRMACAAGWALALALAPGCALELIPYEGDDDTAGDDDTTGGDDVHDLDGDGYTPHDGDCDDEDPWIHPGAEDYWYDGVDGNCDHASDFDQDGDGFDAAGYGGEDCNDLLADVSPTAPEQPNGVDDDCDGAVDEETSWGDDDGDGFSEDDGDCDDTDPGVFPGADEVCDNGVDEDCDGEADGGCPIEHCGTITQDATWTAETPHLVTCPTRLEGGASPTLTIEDGAEVRFAAGAGLAVGLLDPARLVVQGGAEGVLFTSDVPDPAPGDWGGLAFGYYDQGSELTGCAIEYAGSYEPHGGVVVLSASPVLDGCRVSRSQGAGIHVDDDAQPSIVASEVSDNEGYGVYVAGAAEVSIQGSTVVDNAGDGIHIAGTASVAVGTSTISGNGGGGVVVLEGAQLSTGGAPSFTANVVTGNVGAPLSVPTYSAGEIDDSCALTGNGVEPVLLIGDTVDASATWVGLDVPYLVAEDLWVAGPGAPELTLGDGLTLLFDVAAGLLVGDGEPGRLIVDGTGVGVTFTSSAPQPAPGDWDGLLFSYLDTGSSLTGATVSYGGGQEDGSIDIDGPTLPLDGCVVSDSANHGIYLHAGGDLLLADSVIRDNAGDGISSSGSGGLGDAGLPTFTGNTLTGNGGWPMSLPLRSVGAIVPDCTYQGNGRDEIHIVDGSANGMTVDVPAQPVPYFMDDSLYVSYGGSVVIRDGAVLRMDSWSSVQVGVFGAGSLQVEGGVLGVVFTSSSQSPAAGDWEGIRLGPGCDAASTVFEGLTVEYGGANGYGNLLFDGCDGTLRDSVVQHSSAYGVYRLNGASPTLDNVTYADNAAGDLH